MYVYKSTSGRKCTCTCVLRERERERESLSVTHLPVMSSIECLQLVPRCVGKPIRYVCQRSIVSGIPLSIFPCSIRAAVLAHTALTALCTLLTLTPLYLLVQYIHTYIHTPLKQHYLWATHKCALLHIQCTCAVLSRSSLPFKLSELSLLVSPLQYPCPY